ncbi:MAG: hypothetical protein PHH71_02925 [Clostridia bacterium]|nr:hypothetical protein [Clostridia bacterium]
MKFRKTIERLKEIEDTQEKKLSESNSQTPLIKTPFSSDIFQRNSVPKANSSSKIERNSPEIKAPMSNLRPSKIEQLIEQKLQEKRASFLINTEKSSSSNYSKSVQGFSGTATENADNSTKSSGGKVCENVASKENLTKQKFPSKFKSVILETPNYDFIETSKNPENQCNIINIQEKKKQKKSFRAKFSVVLYSIILIICTGWTIFNGIQISNTANEIARIEYSINSFNYIIKIDQLDIIEDHENSIITNVMEVTPPPLTEPTQIQPQTNWFDRLCSWLSNLFK